MARLPQVVKYLVIPLQHAHPDILKAMKRPSDIEHVKHVLQRARTLMPNLAVRTTFIVGFPGETPAHFDAMLGFMREMRFDHVGSFTYFPEDGTPAASLSGQVNDRTKQSRRRRALEAQQAISEELNREWIGREIDVLVEGTAEESLRPGATGLAQLVGRTYRDAPEVDGFVLFQGDAARGEIAKVRIDGAGPYDLFGVQAGLDRVPPAQSFPAPRIGLRSLPVLQPR
jgi:ribosomal protein S12 methylthiotransferase